jgi:DNA-binding transcriptional LysR family regulator
MADLASHRLIALRFVSGVADSWHFERRGNAETLEPQGGLRLFDLGSVVQAATLGLGIAAVSVHHALPWLRDGRLKTVLHDSFQPVRRELALQYPHRAHLAPRVRMVVGHLLEGFKNNPDLHLAEAALLAFSAGPQR